MGEKKRNERKKLLKEEKKTNQKKGGQARRAGGEEEARLSGATFPPPRALGALSSDECWGGHGCRPTAKRYARRCRGGCGLALLPGSRFLRRKSRSACEKGTHTQGVRLTGPAGSRTAAPRGARPRPQTWPAPARSHAARRRCGLPRDGGWDRAGVEPGCLSDSTWGVCFVLSRKRARSPMPRRGPLLRTRGHPERPPVTPASASASPAPHGSRFPEAQAQLLSHSPPAEAETAAGGYT